MIINTIPNPFGKLFYLASNLSKQGRINEEEKGKLKDLIIKEDKKIMDLLNTFSWSQNLQGLENNIVDRILNKKDELEEVTSSPNRSPEGRSNSRNNSKKPSRVVVPSNRQLSFYTNANKPAAGIYVAQVPIKSMPTINMEDEQKFSREENHSPSLQVLPTYTSMAKEIHERLANQLKKNNTLDVSLSQNGKPNVNENVMNDKPEQKENKKENTNGNSMDQSHKKTESNNSEAFQVIVTDVRGRSKTERVDPIATDFLQKPSQLQTIQSTSNESSGNKLLNTSALLSAKTRPSGVNAILESERKTSTLRPPIKNNHSVENTPASKIKDASVVSGNREHGGDNASRRERSLSAFTDESFEPCGFQDYYKAYKKENNIPPSEMGDRDFTAMDGSAHLRPPQFGLGLLRRNTVEVNHAIVMAASKPKEIQGIEEQMDENASPQEKRKSQKKIKKEGSLELFSKKNMMAMNKL